MTAPGSAGLLLTVLTLNWLPLIVGPIASTSTMCQSVSLKIEKGHSNQIHGKIEIKTESTYQQTVWKFCHISATLILCEINFA